MTDINIAIGIDSGPARIGADQYLEQLRRIGAEADKEAKKIRENFENAFGGAGKPFTMPTPPQSAPNTVPPASPQSKPTSIPDQEKQLRSLMAAYAPYDAQLKKLAADHAELDKLKSKAVDPKDIQLYQNMLDNLAHRQRIVTAEQARMASGAKLNAQEMRNLSFQINDVVSGIAMGQSPMMILTQQGGQFFQIWQAAGMSISGVTAGLLAFAAAAATATAAVISNNNSMREVAKSAALTGHNIGIATSDLEDMAVKYGEAADLSVREARNIESAVMKAGVSSKQALDTIATSARGVANALTDGDLQAATDLLTQAFMDPQKAAKQLDSTLNILTSDQVRQVEVLTARNDKEGAFKVLMDALQPRLKDHTDQVWSLSKAWSATTDAVSEFWTQTGKFFGGDKSIEQKLKDLRESQAVSYNPTRAGQIIQLEDQLRKQREEAEKSGKQAQFNLATKGGADVTKALTPGFTDKDNLTSQYKKVEESVNALKEAYKNGTISQEDYSSKMKEHVPILDALKTATLTYKTEGEKAVAMAQAQMNASKMSSAEAQRYLATEQAKINLSGKATTKEEEARIMKAANLQVTAQQNAQTTRTIEAIDQQTKAQDELNKKIGEGWRAQQLANIENQIAAEKIKNPQMSASQVDALRQSLTNKLNSDATKISGDYSKSMKVQTDNQNRLSAAILKGDEAVRQANIDNQVAIQKLNGVDEATAKLRETEASRARYQDQLRNRAAGMNPELQYRNELSQLNDMLNQSMINEEQYTVKVEEANIRRLEAYRDFSSGAEAALRRYALDSKNYGSLAAQGVNQIMYSMENFAATMITKSKSASEAFKNMAQSIIQSMAQMAAKATITGPLSGMLTGLFKSVGGGASADPFSGAGSYMSSASFTNMVGLHDGGVVGTDATFTRNVPATSFYGAGRFHNGGLPGIMPNEVPTILEKGEEVLTANDPRHAMNLGKVPANQNIGGMTNQSVNISDGAIVVNAPGATKEDAHAIAVQVATQVVQLAAPELVRQGARAGVQGVRQLTGKDAAFAKSLRGR